MQTRLFEEFAPAGERPGAAAGPAGSRRGSLPDESDRLRGPGTVVIRASRTTAYGTQRSEFWIPSGLAEISFSELVRESSGHLVLPIDPCCRDDRLLLNHISQALSAFMRLAERSGQRFRGNRINDVGKRFEYMVADALRSGSLDVRVLGRPGYPDCMLKQGDRVTYLEIKTSGSVQRPSNKFFKSFSFSSGKKIESDARHLLLKVQLEEEDSKIWKAVSWELRDLSTLKTRLKTEFNAGFADLAGVRLLGSSDEAAHALTMSGQTVLDERAAQEEQARGRRRRGGRPRGDPMAGLT